MPPVFEKEYEFESQHPFPDTVLAFCLKRRFLPGWPGTREGIISFPLTSSVLSPLGLGKRSSMIMGRQSLARHSILPMQFLEVFCWCCFSESEWLLWKISRMWQ